MYVQDLGETDSYLANAWVVPKSFSCKDPPCLVGEKTQENERAFKGTWENCVERMETHAKSKKWQGKSLLGVNPSLYI